MNISLENRVVIGVILSLIFMLLIAYATYVNTTQVERLNTDISQAQQVIKEVNDILFRVVDMETGERGYIITGDERFLEPYYVGVMELPRQFSSLKNEVSNDVILELVDNLWELILERLSVMETSIERRRDDGMQAAAVIVQAGEGKVLLDRIRLLVNQIIILVNEILKSLLVNSTESNQRGRNTILAESVLAMTLIVFVSFILLRDLRIRRLVEEQLKKERFFLQELIGSAPIPMIMLTPDLNIIANSSKWVESFSAKTGPVKNQSFESLFPDLHTHFEDAFRVSRGGEEVKNPEDQLELANGEQIYLSWLVHPIPTENEGEFNLIVVAYRIDELVEARIRAVEANEAKSSFLARMTHELRTPLNAVLGYAQILQRSPNLKEQERTYLDTMYRSGNHLLNMINDILDISKIEAGRMELVEADFSLSEMLSDLNSMFNLKCADKGIELKNDFAENLPSVLVGDAQKIRQIMINLMGNAVKFTQAGSVTLRVRSAREGDEHHLTIQVEDTGRGIQKSELATVFEPFAQVKGKYSEGTGLGLPISLKLAQLMGGNITLESEENVGSTFTLQLSLLHSETEQLVTKHTMERIIGIKGEKKWKVLVVDDITPNRDVAKILLDDVGFMTDEAENGVIAIEKFKAYNPDVILMDIVMPEKDGIDAMLDIRKLPGGKDTTIIALTASGFDGKNKELKEMGFDEYIRKPFKEHELLESIAQLSGVEFEYESEDTTTGPAETADLEDVARMIKSFSEDKQSEIHDLILEQDFDRLEEIFNKTQVETEMEPAKKMILDMLSQSDYFNLVNLEKKL